MKILKKILPLASIASVAAVAAPLATSCSTDSASVGTYTFSYDVEDTAGLTKYEPKFAPAPQQSTESMTISAARTLYYNKLDADHSLLSDDFLCGLNAYMVNVFSQITDKEYELKKISGSSDLTLNSVEPYSVDERTQNAEKIEKRKISFTIQWKFDYTLVTENDEGEEIEKVGSITQKFEFKNFILDIKSAKVTNLGIVSFGYDEKVGWELTFGSSTSFDGASQSGSITWNKDNYMDKGSRLATRIIPTPQLSNTDFTSMVEPVNIGFSNVASLFTKMSQECFDDEGDVINATHYLMKNSVK